MPFGRYGDATPRATPPFVASPNAPYPRKRTRREELEEEYSKKTTLKQRLLEIAIAAVPTILGAAFGGESGATGAAEGSAFSLSQHRARQARRKESLLESIERERGFEEAEGRQQAGFEQQRTIEEMREGAARERYESAEASAERRHRESLKSAAQRDTVETGEGVFQLNPETGKYDIKVGPGRERGGGGQPTPFGAYASGDPNLKRAAEEWQRMQKREGGEPSKGSGVVDVGEGGEVQGIWYPKTQEYVKAPEGMRKTATSAEKIKQRENASSGLRALDTLEGELDKNSYALAQEALPGSPGARITRTAKSEIMDVLARLRTGAAIRPDEEVFYRGQLPGPLDSDETVKYKLGLFRDLFRRLALGTPEAIGGAPQGGGVPEQQGGRPKTAEEYLRKKRGQ